MGRHPDRQCEICKTTFTPRRSPDRTCSLDCQIEWRRHLSREKARKHYKPRAPRPDVQCQCGKTIAVPKTGPLPKWCESCKATRESDRASKRQAVRRCYKCRTPLPEATRQPGKAVCDECRTDPRKHREAHEQARRLRKYGIDQDTYNQLLTEQDGRCAGCGTDDPGLKGWCIDHHHGTGTVRALMCSRCNTALGLTDEDPRILRALADFAEQHNRV